MQRTAGAHVARRRKAREAGVDETRGVGEGLGAWPAAVVSRAGEPEKGEREGRGPEG